MCAVRFGAAAAVLLLSTAAAATGASVLAVNSPRTVTVTYGRVALEVPGNWTLERRPTCTSRTSVLRVSSPSLGQPVEWIMVGEIARAARPACSGDARAEPGAPPVVLEHIVLHGLGVTELSGPGIPRDHVQWSVPSLGIAIWGVGPDVSRIVHTLHRSG